MEDTRSCRSDDGEQGDDDAGDAWEDDGPRGWVEALGWMKGCEMQRRLSFREWVDSARALLAEQKLQLKSARQLATVVRAHIREQSDAEEEFAKRLAKAAAQRHRAESALDWTDEDRADVAFLSQVQGCCARLVEEGARALRTLLEGTDGLVKWEALGKSIVKEIAAAEQALRRAEELGAKCEALWAEHEEPCRARLQPGAAAQGAAKPAKAVDLWASEVLYRRGVAAFERAVAKCVALVTALRREMAGVSEQHRGLARGVLRDVAGRAAETFGSVAQALRPPAPAEGGSPRGELPRLPGLPAAAGGPPPPRRGGHGKGGPAPPGQARGGEELANPSFPALPPSIFVQCQGPMRRPPKGPELLRSWRPCHLVLTTDGHVHCFNEIGDVGARDALWRARPGRGAALTVELNQGVSGMSRARLHFLQAGAWPLRRQRRRTVEASNQEHLAAWEGALRLWWSDEQAMGAGDPSASSSAPAPPEDGVSTEAEPRDAARTDASPGRGVSPRDSDASAGPQAAEGRPPEQPGGGTAWACPVCTSLNDSSSAACLACAGVQSARAAPPEEPPPGSPAPSAAAPSREGPSAPGPHDEQPAAAPGEPKEPEEPATPQRQRLSEQPGAEGFKQELERTLARRNAEARLAPDAEGRAGAAPEPGRPPEEDGEVID